VPGHGQDKDVTLLGAREQLAHAAEDAILRRSVVEEEADLPGRETVLFV
jgi:hypothetical protein